MRPPLYPKEGLTVEYTDLLAITHMGIHAYRHVPKLRVTGPNVAEAQCVAATTYATERLESHI